MKNISPVRVAVLAERLGTSAGGTEVYERNILNSLHERGSESGSFRIIPVLAWRRAIETLPSKLRRDCHLLKPEGKIGTIVSAGWTIRKIRADVVHCCFVVPPFIGNTPLVTTIHDLGFVRRKEHYPFLLAWRLVKALQYAVRKSDILVAVSRNTREDLISLTTARPDRVISIHNGLDEKFLSGVSWAPCKSDILVKYGVRGPYILYAGKIEPRKNIPVLVDAFDLLKETGRFKGQLVLVGSPRSFLWETAQRRIDQSKYRADILQTGYVPDDEIPSLYYHAKAVAFVSLYEGFGFPLLEAMASGVPIVCSNSTCLPEIAGGAALQVNPDDPAEIADALSRVLHDEDLRDSLVRKGIERISGFSWHCVADQLLDLYWGLSNRVGDWRRDGIE